MAIDPNNLAATAHLTFDEEFNSLSLIHNFTGAGTWNTAFDYAPNGSTTGTTLLVSADSAKTAGITPWTVKDGILTITASPAPSGLGAKYTSGQLDTQHAFSQQYGYFEMRAKMPAADSNAAVSDAGNQGGAAFWLLPENGKWPPELDVFESTSWGGVFTSHTEQTGSHTAQSTWKNIPDAATTFHTYGVDWEADKITWFVDGKQVFQTATPADMHDPMYLLLDLYTNNTGGSPAQFQVDYVRAYASGAGGGITPPTQTSGTGTGTTTGGTSQSAPPAATTPPATTVNNPAPSTDTNTSQQGSNTTSGGHHGHRGHHSSSDTSSSVTAAADVAATPTTDTITPQTSATAAPEATSDTGGFTWASGGACFAAPDVSMPMQQLTDTTQPAPLTISPEVAQQAMTFDPSSKYFAKTQDWHWG